MLRRPLHEAIWSGGEASRARPVPKVCGADPAGGVNLLWLLLLPGWLTLPTYFSVLERQNTEERDEGLPVV